MKVQYFKKINDNKTCLTINKFYDVIDTRRWNNGAIQYLIIDNKGEYNWFSEKRFNNRRKKLQKINESQLSK